MSGSAEARGFRRASALCPGTSDENSRLCITGVGRHLVALSVFLLLGACGRFAGQADLHVVIPDPPGTWVRAFPDLSFRLAFPDGSGRWQSRSVEDRGLTAGISCSKAGNTPVLAYPVSGRSAGLLRPAGGLYPADLRDQGRDGERLELSWQRGCLALVFAGLAERGIDTSLVNSARLASFMARHPDPWVLDLDRIVEKLILDDFSAYDIDILPSRDVTLLPGAGEWFLESPFAPVLGVSDGETLVLPGLTVGMHGLFSVQGERIRIWVGEAETVIWPRE